MVFTINASRKAISRATRAFTMITPFEVLLCFSVVSPSSIAFAAMAGG